MTRQEIIEGIGNGWHPHHRTLSSVMSCERCLKPLGDSLDRKRPIPQMDTPRGSMVRMRHHQNVDIGGYI